jgi:hypothetical protein
MYEMNKINLNEAYLHNKIVESINKLIKEDMGVTEFDYITDIENGEVDYIDYDDSEAIVHIIGESDTTFKNTSENEDTFAYYTIKCYVRADEVRAGRSGDYFNPPEPSEYEYYLDIDSVLVCHNDEGIDEDITDKVDIDSLEGIIYNVIDWENVENIYSLDDRYWDARSDRYDD